jgi:hypothetical protein
MENKKINELIKLVANLQEFLDEIEAKNGDRETIIEIQKEIDKMETTIISILEK